MIKKLCSYPGCHKVVEAGVKYCDKHRETDRKKYREYKQRRMRDEQEARRQQFYNSKAWEQFRAAQAAAQLGIDIYEYYTTGRIIDAVNYHHIQEITEAWARRLDAANVIGLSEANHRRIHKEYDRSYKASLLMLRRLRISLIPYLKPVPLRRYHLLSLLRSRCRSFGLLPWISSRLTPGGSFS